MTPPGRVFRAPPSGMLNRKVALKVLIGLGLKLGKIGGALPPRSRGGRQVASHYIVSVYAMESRTASRVLTRRLFFRVPAAAAASFYSARKRIRIGRRGFR